MSAEKLKAWCKKKMTRDNMIVLALSGILLMVIALPAGKKDATGATESVLLDADGAMMGADETQNAPEEEQELERRLEELLSSMEGVGKAKVMLTFASTQEQVVEKDIPSSWSVSEETDSAGGSRHTESRNLEEETLFITDRAGNQVPYVKKTLAAQVEGVTVLAQGGAQPVIQKNITDVIQALFGIEVHKIKVAKLAAAQ